MKETKRGNSTVKEKKTVESKTEKVTQVAQATKSSAEPKVIAVTELSNVPPMEHFHDLVSQAAYFLWEKEGYQHGREREYWLRAEELVKQNQMN